MPIDVNAPVVPAELRATDFALGPDDISLNLDRAVLGNGPNGLTVLSLPDGLAPPPASDTRVTAHGFDGEVNPPTFTSTLSDGTQVQVGMPGVITEAALRNGRAGIRSAFGSIIRVEITG